MISWTSSDKDHPGSDRSPAFSGLRAPLGDAHNPGLRKYAPAMDDVWRHRFVMAAPFLGVAFLASGMVGDDGPTLCPFALFTGIACPGCGMTRAAATLMRGDVGAALTYHPLVPLVVAQLLAGWVWYLLRRKGKVRAMKPVTFNLLLIANLLVLVGVWVIRLTNGTLPPV